MTESGYPTRIPIIMSTPAPGITACVLASSSLGKGPQLAAANISPPQEFSARTPKTAPEAEVLPIPSRISNPMNAGILRRVLPALVLLMGAWLDCTGNAQAGVGYSMVDLGDLGGQYSQARGINEQSQVVGESLLPGAGTVQHAFSWQAGGGLSDLGTLGGENSRAVDINRSGTISGWAQDAFGLAKPALWSGNTVAELSTLGGNSGAAWGLNDAGTAVGNAELSGGGYHAALWDEGGVKDLGTLGGDYSVAYDINNSGSIVGTAYDGAGRERACLWDAGGPVDLGALPGGQWTTARDINELGQLILWGTPSGAAGNHAVFWSGDSQDPVVDLGTFGGTESWAYGMNNQGSVVGWAGEEDGTYHAFVWDGTAMTDLGTLGGPFSAAYGINDQGTIVGWAQDGGGITHAIAWVAVPEPGRGLLLLMGGMFGLYAMRRRQRLTRNRSVPATAAQKLGA